MGGRYSSVLEMDPAERGVSNNASVRVKVKVMVRVMVRVKVRVTRVGGSLQWRPEDGPWKVWG